MRMDAFEKLMVVISVLLIILEIAAGVFLVWVGVSFLDVVVHNLTEGWAPNTWNFFSFFK